MTRTNHPMASVPKPLRKYNRCRAITGSHKTPRPRKPYRSRFHLRQNVFSRILSTRIGRCRPRRAPLILVSPLSSQRRILRSSRGGGNARGRVTRGGKSRCSLGVKRVRTALSLISTRLLFIIRNLLRSDSQESWRSRGPWRTMKVKTLRNFAKKSMLINVSSIENCKRKTSSSKKIKRGP